MPVSSPHPCNKPGCGALTRVRFCEVHASRTTETKRSGGRGSARERGYTSRWDRQSKRYRQTHPLCEHCEDAGKTKPSELVDHIIPAHAAPDLFWIEGNWAALCRACHAVKTALDLPIYGSPQAPVVQMAPAGALPHAAGKERGRGA